jgi:hypothetical protein
MTIEGGTGTSKSTLAYHIANGVSKEFKRLFRMDEYLLQYYYDRVIQKQGKSMDDFIRQLLEYKEKKQYIFIPPRDLIYSQDSMKQFLSAWNRVGIADEMINVTFNRDFFSEDQKDIIKIINMFRDHQNLVIACVPFFANLDTQIKNLCKMKISVRRRGLGIVHTPNQVVYCKDKWDSATNEAIERQWIMTKNKKPNYSKLTTFRGLITYPKLSEKQEAQYQKIKNDKRAIILKDEMHVELKTEKSYTDLLYEKLVNKEIRNMQIIEGVAMAHNISEDKLKAELTKRLKKDKKPHLLGLYFWDKKSKKKDKPDLKEQFFDVLAED